MQSHPLRPVIDTAALDAIREMVGDDDPMMFTEIIDTYLTESPPLVAAMRSAVSQNNIEELTRAAHSLKSSSEYLGAMGLVELCKQMEQLGRSNQVQHQAKEIAAVLEEIESQYVAVAAALQQERHVT